MQPGGRFPQGDRLAERASDRWSRGTRAEGTACGDCTAHRLCRCRGRRRHRMGIPLRRSAATAGRVDRTDRLLAADRSPYGYRQEGDRAYCVCICGDVCRSFCHSITRGAIRDGEPAHRLTRRLGASETLASGASPPVSKRQREAARCCEDRVRPKSPRAQGRQQRGGRQPRRAVTARGQHADRAAAALSCGLGGSAASVGAPPMSPKWPRCDSNVRSVSPSVAAEGSRFRKAAGSQSRIIDIWDRAAGLVPTLLSHGGRPARRTHPQCIRARGRRSTERGRRGRGPPGGRASLERRTTARGTLRTSYQDCPQPGVGCCHNGGAGSQAGVGHTALGSRAWNEHDRTTPPTSRTTVDRSLSVGPVMCSWLHSPRIEPHLRVEPGISEATLVDLAPHPCALRDRRPHGGPHVHRVGVPAGAPGRGRRAHQVPARTSPAASRRRRSTGGFRATLKAGRRP